MKKYVWIVIALSLNAAGCNFWVNEPVDDAKADGKTSTDFPQLRTDVFKKMDGGIELDLRQVMGRNTWNLWTGGSQVFLDRMAREGFGLIDVIKVIDSRKRATRFKDAGLINEPGFKTPDQPDEYGLWLDVPSDGSEMGEVDKKIAEEGIDPSVYGRSTGIFGMRIYPNPDFDEAARKHWDPQKYYSDSIYATDPKLVRPYRVGMTCGLCHISPHPLNPPADPENPGWENLVSAIGNQYFKEGAVFTQGLKPQNFLWQMINAQPAGTSDTSRIATDHINNPNAMNAIFDLNARVQTAMRADAEEMAPSGRLLPGDQEKWRNVPHILKDGADSIGVPGATIRVYINIGMFSQQWLELHNPIVGIVPQKPFRIDKAQRNSVYWRATEERLLNVAKFFTQIKPFRLADAPGGASHITNNPVVMNRGKIVFAENCAKCHSGKLPPKNIGSLKSAEATQWFREAVMEADYLDDNFLSTEERISVTDVETNSARALGTNATRKNIWDNFSSETYKNQPAVGVIEGYNPADPSTPYRFKAPGGGVGYYRVPSLIAIWTSAPFLHNNSLGKFTGDPSVSGRMEAFNDAVEKLLWPAKRDNLGSIWRTTQESYIEIPSTLIPTPLRYLLKEHIGDDTMFKLGPIPKGTPINLLANLNLRLGDGNLDELAKLVIRLKITLAKIKLEGLNPQQAKELMRTELVPALLDASKCPDLVEDRGHYYGTTLSDGDKKALIEYLKTM